jgi:hypothetical protein
MREIIGHRVFCQLRAKQGQELGDKMDAQAKEDEARMMKIQTEARLKAEAQFQEKLRRERADRASYSSCHSVGPLEALI